MTCVWDRYNIDHHDVVPNIFLSCLSDQAELRLQWIYVGWVKQTNSKLRESPLCGNLVYALEFQMSPTWVFIQLSLLVAAYL